MSEEPAKTSTVKSCAIAVAAYLVLTMLASGPFRASLRNHRISNSTYGMLQPLFIPAGFVCELPGVSDLMYDYWNWWDGFLKK